MYVKPIEVSKHILQMEALDRRLRPTHPQKEHIHNYAGSLRSGYFGEKSLEFQFKFLPEDEFLIFHNLRIRDDDGDHFQIDFLLLSPYFISLIDAKNIDGKILYDGMDQTVRLKDEKEDIFTNPIMQVNLQHLRLLRWLKQFDFPPIPIEKLVVYSHQKSFIRNLTDDKSISNIVMRKEKLLSKINQFQQIHQSPCFSEEQLLNLATQLVAADCPKEENILEKYGITMNDLIKGAFCPSCKGIPMIRKTGKWHCQDCGSISKTAHVDALKDYALLLGVYINNRQAREFLQLDSEYVVKRLLQGLKSEQIGVNSGRKYCLRHLFSL